MKKHCALLLLCILAPFVVAHSQQPSRLDSLQEISEVEVYGKRPLATTQTLRGADLQALSTTSVADALKYFSGVQIKDYGGLGGLKTINVPAKKANYYKSRLPEDLHALIVELPAEKKK